MTKRQRLGSLLVAASTITHEQLDAALSAQRQFRGRLGTNLVELRHLSVDQLAAALSYQHDVPAAGRSDFLTMDSSLVHLLPPRAAKMYLAVPLGPSPTNPRVIQVAMMDPNNIVALDEISTILGCRVTPLVTPELRMLHLLERVYGIKPARRTFVRVVLDRPLLQRSRRPSDTPAGAASAPPKARELSLTPPSIAAAQMPPPAGDRTLPAARRSAVSSPATPFAPTEPPQPRLSPPPLPGSLELRPPAIEPLRAGRAPHAPPPSLQTGHLLFRGTDTDRARRVPKDALPLVGTYEPDDTSNELAPGLVVYDGIELDQGRYSERLTASPKEEPSAALTRQAPTDRLPLRNFIRFPKQAQGAEQPPALALGDLAEDDALELLNRLPVAREPSPVPPAPSDPTALTLDTASGRTRSSALPPKSAGVGKLPILDYSHAATQGTALSVREAAAGIVEHSLELTARELHRELDPQKSTGQSVLATDEALACTLAELDSVAERDSVGLVVARYLGCVFGCGVILVVKGELASGWIGAAPGLTAATVESLHVPLGEASLFQTVARTTKPYRGAAPAPPDAVLRRFWTVFKAEPTREILVFPVVLRARVVNLIYAQSGPSSALPIMAEADMMQVVAGMVRTYQRLIQARHGGSSIQGR